MCDIVSAGSGIESLSMNYLNSYVFLRRETCGTFWEMVLIHCATFTGCPTLITQVLGLNFHPIIYSLFSVIGFKIIQ
jgi:hypothetical protein